MLISLRESGADVGSLQGSWVHEFVMCGAPSLVTCIVPRCVRYARRWILQWL